MNTTTPSPEALKAAVRIKRLAVLNDDVAIVIQQAIDTAVAERTKALRDELQHALEYLESPPFVALHGDAPARRARNALKPENQS